ncbi:hypothetical protein EC957_002447 [Mortierella hygrophila]|uniref:Ion transport domain-containing protein n=1 Tax=Mortierella hygrophila TaxID=979708 RepID=A0A9P6FFW5_9FUNG|nr:hypothetical protein EC957_002447 [Mortierella hygrophila]
MADFIVKISEDSDVEAVPLLSTNCQAPSAVVSSSPGTIATSEATAPSRPPKAYRWYLHDSDDDSTLTEPSLALDDKYHEPVKIRASNRLIKWEIVLPSDREKGEFYDIVLGVSTRSLDMDAIESILIRVEQEKATYKSLECEVFKRHELERMSVADEVYKGTDNGTDNGTDKDKNDVKEMYGEVIEKSVTEFKWKLFIRCNGIGERVSITMEINTWPELPLEFGSLDLHFVELCTDSTVLYKAEHCPYSTWLADVNRSGCPEYDLLTRTFRQMTHFGYSGDGRFMVIKTLVDEEEFLEVWDLQDHEIANALGRDGSESTKEEVMVKPYRATPVAWMPLIRGGETDVSISWDGSLVALFETERPKATEDDKEDPLENYQGRFAIYKCSWDDNGASEKPSSRMSLVRHDVQHTCPGLKDYIGEGVFHIVDKSNPDPKDELFVACDGITIDIYSTFEDWTHLRGIVMDSAFARQNLQFKMGFTMFNQIQGRYLVTINDSVAFTFDIILGTLVSFSTNLPNRANLNYFSNISADGDWVAIPGYRHVNVYRTQTWTLQGSYIFDELESDERVTNVMFMDSGRLLYIMVGLIPGYILDVATMSVVGRVVANMCESVSSARLDGSGQGLVCSGYTKLWDTCLADLRTHPSPDGDVSRCIDRCNHLDSIHSGVEEGTSPSGLRLKVQRTETSIGSQLKRDKRLSVTVTMADTTGTQIKKMVVPLPRESTIEQAALFADCRYLLVVANGIFMAWSVPTTAEGEFRLQMILQNEYNKEWTICTHGIVGRSSDEGEEGRHHVGHVRQPLTKPLAEEFLDGLGNMIWFYELADVGLRQEILRYYGRHINSYPNKAERWSVLCVCVLMWDRYNHHIMCGFIKDLLSFPGVRWVPHYSLSIELNPLATLLDKAKTEPFVNAGVQIIVDYCLRQAKAAQDPHFLSPILQCLPSLVDPKQLYSEIARTIYREVAFFPAQGRDFIVDNHILINSSTFRWKFWQPNPWGLHQYKDQVLQFKPHEIPNPPKGNFTRDIFQAPFDLLWHKSEDAGSQDSSEGSQEATTAKTLFSWPHAIWTMVLRKCKMRYNTTIECYPFELQTLDNPALMALVEYKWNTIGFKYWFIRFLGQMCFYLMVLTAIFFQIYVEPNLAEEHNGRIDLGLESLFVAIIVVAFIFLWLELVQLLRDKRDYIQFVYNWVDLLVFLLPLAGAINQILIIQGVIELGLNPGLLSFSVLFIFLHFLFELRVFQAVCHFVSIIIHAIHAIRVFFFVFAGGILAFSIAIVHLYHICTSDECSYFTDEFSSNLLRAFSMTYFMMGGNYDPVENGFSGNNFAFHMMMIVFFFFTVILMLNVLIALINNAINDGDHTWKLDWLEYRMRYVESAENLTYHIPGFREKDNLFPDKIYYTGTPKQVRDYEKRTREIQEQSAPDDDSLTKQFPGSSFSATSDDVVAAAPAEKSELVRIATRRRGPATDAQLTPSGENDLRKRLESVQASSEKQIGELKLQLKEQQQMLVQILAKLDR